MMRILIVNVGSTSIKLRVVGDDDEIEGATDLPASPRGGREQLRQWLAGLESVDAVGHRIVHGGPKFVSPVVVDDRVAKELRDLTDLAPLHQPPALDALDLVRAALPDVPSIACFDTAFHSTLPAEAYTYAVPPRWRDLGARRYGFHGLSHAWASRRATQMVGPAVARMVTCHLGGGESLAAVSGGRSVDTTMGFTPLEGLVMSTRSGSVDPGLIIWLQQHRGMTVARICDDLEHHSGLLGLCGTDDIRQVLTRAAAGDPAAVTALNVYVHRLRAGIASMAAALAGLDALVFTGGVGEHAAPVREAACSGLGFLGVALDPVTNATAVADQEVSLPGSGVRVLVIEAREDLEIARGVRAVLEDRS